MKFKNRINNAGSVLGTMLVTTDNDKVVASYCGIARSYVDLVKKDFNIEGGDIKNIAVANQVAFARVINELSIIDMDKLNSVIRSTINYEFDRNLTAVSHEPKDALDVLGIRTSLGDGIIDALNKYPKEYEKARALTVDYLNFIVEK